MFAEAASLLLFAATSKIGRGQNCVMDEDNPFPFLVKFGQTVKYNFFGVLWFMITIFSVLLKGAP
jgi:hypothetical protein